MSPLPADRRHDVDWLRVIATYLLFVFHVSMVFNPAPFFHIRNSETSVVFMVLAGFISLWHMPLFFLLAGWSAFASISARGSAGFLRERWIKLAIPLVAGVLLWGPPMKYLELSTGVDLNHRGLRVSAELQESFSQIIPSGLPLMEPFDQSYLEFLPTFFTAERVTWGHLWFLAYLFAFSLLYTPLLKRIAAGRERFTAASGIWVYLPLAPLAAIQLLLRPLWPGIYNLYNDWANFAFYSTFLICGFLLARHPGLGRAVEREWRRALGIGLATALLLLGAVLGLLTWAPLILVGASVAGWCFVVAILGFARSRRPLESRMLSYLSESAFPVYILHQPTIILIGYPLIQLPLGIAAKFALVLVTSVATTLVVYHFAVRRIATLRFLHGMKRGSPRGRTSRSGALPRALAPLAALAVCAGSAAGAQAEDPTGLWWADGGSAQVQIAEEADELRGRVVWLRSPFDADGCPLVDRQNPDPEQRERPLVGIDILSGLHPDTSQPDSWTGGRVYDPGSGRSFSCALEMRGPDRMELRGYLGLRLLGRTTTWIRVGAEAAQCSAR